MRQIFNRYFFLLLLASITLQFTYAQDTKKDDPKKAEVQNLIQSKEYVFVAQSVLPLSGRSMNLTSLYNLKVNGDTIVSDLPYFGRAFVAPINPAEGGIHFTSTDFSYDVKNRKKGGWEISIIPKDAKDVRQLFLTISEDGYASLQVTSNNKQSIGYNGYVTSRE